MLFKKQEFTIRFAGDDFVGVPFKDAETAIAVAEAQAVIDAKLREMKDAREILPWTDD